LSRKKYENTILHSSLGRKNNFRVIQTCFGIPSATTQSDLHSGYEGEWVCVSVCVCVYERERERERERETQRERETGVISWITNWFQNVHKETMFLLIKLSGKDISDAF
jgi:hypothetical protein